MNTYCSRRNPDCKTCTKEAYDKWNLSLKNNPPPPFTGMPYNEKLVDFIRWQELAAFVVIMISALIIFGGWGFIIGPLFDYCMHLQGGPNFGTSPKKELVVKYKKVCSKGPCNFCAVIVQ